MNENREILFATVVKLYIEDLMRLEDKSRDVVSAEISRKIAEALKQYPDHFSADQVESLRQAFVKLIFEV